MRRIVAVIESEGEHGLSALSQAVIMAEHDQEAPEVLALHHVYNVPAQIEKMFHGSYLNNLTRPLIEEAEKWAEGAIKAYADSTVRETGAPITLRTEVMWENRAHKAIAKVCAENEADLIIKVSDQRSRWVEWMLHTEDWHVLTHTPTEVLMIDGVTTFTQGKLLVALDAFDASHEALNKKLLSRAVSLAKTFDMQVRVVHAYPDVNSLPNYGLELGNYVSDQVIIDIKNKHLEATETLVEAAGLDKKSVVVEPGPAAMLIAAQVEDFKPNCLMVGNLHEKGVAGLVSHKPYSQLKSTVEGCSLWVVPD